MVSPPIAIGLFVNKIVTISPTKAAFHFPSSIPSARTNASSPSPLSCRDRRLSLTMMNCIWARNTDVETLDPVAGEVVQGREE